jgi:HlyD family secretion protein
MSAVAIRRSANEEASTSTVALAPLSPRLGLVAWAGNLLICVFVFAFGTWAYLAPLESAAIAPGSVESESNRKTIQHLEGGIIRAILVKDGSLVRVGQPLIKLDDTRARSELSALAGQFWDAKARQARLIAERDGKEAITFPPDLASAQAVSTSTKEVLLGQQKIFESRREVLRAQARIIEEKKGQVRNEIVGLSAQGAASKIRAEIIKQELEIVVPLVEKGMERRPRLLTLEREMADIDGRRGEIAAQISRANQVVSEAQANLLKLESDRQNEIAQLLRETENQIFQLGEKIRAANDQLSRTEIRAPEAGIVTDLRVHTAGGVIGAGAPLMDLVPQEDKLIVMARLRPEDIAVVHPELSADVHLLSYNQRRVPALKGKVVYVSADRLLDKRTDQPYYSAKILITDERLRTMKDVELIPGMPAQSFIKTGQSTVALYALRPLLDSFNGAFREN